MSFSFAGSGLKGCSGRGLSLRLLDRQSVEFFLDEDPERAYRELNVEVAGILSFLPGRAA